MKMMVILSLLLVCALSVDAAGQDIALPKVEAKAGMDVVQAMESRAASRRYDGREVPLEAISTILWAGCGIILESGGRQFTDMMPCRVRLLKTGIQYRGAGDPRTCESISC